MALKDALLPREIVALTTLPQSGFVQQPISLSICNKHRPRITNAVHSTTLTIAESAAHPPSRQQAGSSPHVRIVGKPSKWSVKLPRNRLRGDQGESRTQQHISPKQTSGQSR